MSIKQDRGTAFSVTARGAGTVVAIQSAGTNLIYFITDVGVSTTGGTANASGTFAVMTGTETILWQGQVSTAPYEKVFSTPLVGSPGLLVKVYANGTTVTCANLSGFSTAIGSTT